MQKNLALKITLDRRIKYLHCKQKEKKIPLYKNYKKKIKNYLFKITSKYHNICNGYKRRLLAVQFFDFTRECPEKILNCKELRDEYFLQLKKLEKYNMCTPCKIPFLQERIIQLFIIR
jgi:hypothetical protein